MNIISMSIAAEVLGTGLGVLIIVLLGKRTDKTISVLLSFASGIMISIVFFELIPEAELHANPAVIMAGLVIGVVMVLILDDIIDNVSDTEHKPLSSHETYEEFYHGEKIITGAKSLMKSGVLMFFVIGLHNIPEGLAIGAAGKHNIALGATLALMIGIHNIPEGMSVAAPLVSGGMNKGKAAFMTMLTGVPTVLGAGLGVLLGGISDITVALSFSIAAGAMLYAVLGEILPQSIKMSKNRVPTLFLLLGAFFGYLITKI
ncbi:MAG: ZIP family metal transporter [Oscillospiraceae bacterium]|nr:ZIP family metal transporter [Oscillospiraceae bacterium]